MIARSRAWRGRRPVGGHGGGGRRRRRRSSRPRAPAGSSSDTAGQHEHQDDRERRRARRPRPGPAAAGRPAPASGRGAGVGAPAAVLSAAGSGGRPPRRRASPHGGVAATGEARGSTTASSSDGRRPRIPRAAAPSGRRGGDRGRRRGGRSGMRPARAASAAHVGAPPPAGGLRRAAGPAEADVVAAGSRTSDRRDPCDEPRAASASRSAGDPADDRDGAGRLHRTVRGEDRGEVAAGNQGLSRNSAPRPRRAAGPGRRAARPASRPARPRGEARPVGGVGGQRLRQHRERDLPVVLGVDGAVHLAGPGPVERRLDPVGAELRRAPRVGGQLTKSLLTARSTSPTGSDARLPAPGDASDPSAPTSSWVQTRIACCSRRCSTRRPARCCRSCSSQPCVPGVGEQGASGSGGPVAAHVGLEDLVERVAVLVEEEVRHLRARLHQGRSAEEAGEGAVAVGLVARVAVALVEGRREDRAQRVLRVVLDRRLAGDGLGGDRSW